MSKFYINSQKKGGCLCFNLSCVDLVRFVFPLRIEVEEGRKKEEGVFPKSLTTALYGLLAAWVMLFTIPAGSVYAQSSRYDNFNSGALSPARWSTQQQGTGGLELVREIRNGRLLMEYRVLGMIDTGQITSINRLNFELGRNLTALRFDITVRDVSVLGCSDPGGNISRSFAGFNGTLFNDGSSSGSGDATGNFGAFLFVERRSDSEEPPEMLHVIAGTFRCLNNGCSRVEDVQEDLGTVTIGEEVSLQMVWDELNSQIRFRKNRDAVVRVRYEGSVARRINGRTLQIRGDAANCLDGPRPVAAMSAFFDNVFINP
jgi:hypothetical protein